MLFVTKSYDMKLNGNYLVKIWLPQRLNVAESSKVNNYVTYYSINHGP